MSVPDPGHGEPPTGLQRLMGYHLAEWSDGRAMVELEIGPPHLNRAGVVHGGVLATLLYTALGYAGCWCAVPGRYRSAVTLSLATSFTGQARSGRLRALGRKGPGGTRIFTCTGEVLGPQCEVLAMAQGVFRYRSGSERPEGVPRHKG
jgi:uncharacterized protein (TIGR00369 family)